MIDEQAVKEVLAQYEKHGWILRRVLLSARTRENMPPAIFGAAEVVSAESDAAWFSRGAGEGRETWELRTLSGAPFALVEVFDADDEEEVRAETRVEMETRLTAQASKNRNPKAAN